VALHDHRARLHRRLRSGHGDLLRRELPRWRDCVLCGARHPGPHLGKGWGFRRMDGDAAGIWERVETLRLPQVFGDLVAKKIWDNILSRDEDFSNLLVGHYYVWDMASVEIHEVGDDAEFVLLTVGKLGPVFLLDVKKRTVEKVLTSEQDDDGRRLCGISAFMMPWPPVFPALNERG
jgi:hypothetical protein